MENTTILPAGATLALQVFGRCAEITARPAGCTAEPDEGDTLSLSESDRLFPAMDARWMSRALRQGRPARIELPASEALARFARLARRLLPESVA
jgi:hypothetical protein